MNNLIVLQASIGAESVRRRSSHCYKHESRVRARLFAYRPDIDSPDVELAVAKRTLDRLTEMNSKARRSPLTAQTAKPGETSLRPTRPSTILWLVGDLRTCRSRPPVAQIMRRDLPPLFSRANFTPAGEEAQVGLPHASGNGVRDHERS